MPRPFTDFEDQEILTNLKNAARRQFSAQGVRRTSLEQLTRAAGISKGSFYKYFPSKERLYFTLLEESQNSIRSRLLPTGENIERSKSEFIERCQAVFKDICQDPIIKLMGTSEEYAIISRRVPETTLTDHQEQDRQFLNQLTNFWSDNAIQADLVNVAAGISLVVSTALNREFYGDILFLPARDIVINGLADLLFRMQ